MLRNRLLAPAACCVGTLLLAGCYSTSPSHRPESHARADSRNVHTAFGARPTDFAAGNKHVDNSGFGYDNLQQASHQTKPPPDLLSRILPVSPPPPGSRSSGPDEPILAAVARELGIRRLSDPTRRDGPRGLVPRVAGRFNKSGPVNDPGKRIDSRPPQAPESFAATAADRNVLEKLHRDAADLRTADDGFPSPIVDDRPTSLPHPNELEGPPTKFYGQARELTPGPSPFAPALATSQLDVPVPRVEINIPVPPAAQTKSIPQNIAQIPSRFYHSEDYRVLSGEVQQFRNTWRLRYARVDEVDQYGGSVILAGEKRFDNLRDGQLIRVQGRVVQNDRNGPVFEVQAIETGER